MSQIECNNCYMPIGKPESEMTEEEKKTMQEFEILRQINRLSDMLHWDTQLQCNVYKNAFKK